MPTPGNEWFKGSAVPPMPVLISRNIVGGTKYVDSERGTIWVYFALKVLIVYWSLHARPKENHKARRG